MSSSEGAHQASQGARQASQAPPDAYDDYASDGVEDAFDPARLDYRPAARQIVIDTGVTDTSDRWSPDGSPGVDPAPSGDGPGGQHGGGTRRNIRGFTERSRRRLRRWVHSVPRDAECLFCTLTYHETDPHPREAKEHLDSLCKRLRRKYPSAAIIWKMEPQQRGTVHFHLLVYGVQYIPASKLSAVWHHITDEDSREHRAAGVDIERGVHRDDGKLQSYLSKYLAKLESNPWQDPGRFWGIRGRSELPMGSWETAFTMTRAEAQRMIFDLLEEWGVDLPDYVSIPRLTICTRGDPADVIPHLP